MMVDEIPPQVVTTSLLQVDAIRLQNFRGFKNTTIELKPLTVLLGPNSAGKSSFGQALTAMAEANVRKVRSLTPPPLDLPNWAVDLGTYEKLRTQGEEGPVLIALLVGQYWIEHGFGRAGEPDLELSRLTFPAWVDDVSRTPGTSSAADHSIGHDLEHVIERIDGNKWFDANVTTLPEFSGLRLVRTIDTAKVATPFPDPFDALFADFLPKITYVPPLRFRPARAYGPWPLKDTVTFYPERVPTLLLEKGDIQCWKMVPPRVPRTRDEALEQLSGCCEGAETAPLLEVVACWLNRLGLARSVDARKREDSQIEIRVRLDAEANPRDLPDVGFGVSQVLPVIAGGLLSQPGGLFIVDLPEAHLHPAPQAELADFFYAMVKSGRRALVETHSEALFHRLRVRSALDKDFAGKVAVYFIDAEKNGRCCDPVRIDLRPDKVFKWPTGFFAESWEEERSLDAIQEAALLPRSPE